MPRDERVGVGVTLLLAAGDKWDGKPRVLMGKRCGKLFAGVWALPGGWQEFGEHPSQTAARELQEETGIAGLNPNQFELLAIEPHLVEDLHVWCNTVYYVLHIGWPFNATVMEPDKMSEWRWFLESEIPRNLAPTTGKVLAKFFCTKPEDYLNRPVR